MANHPLTLVWKTLKGVTIVIIIIRKLLKTSGDLQSLKTSVKNHLNAIIIVITIIWKPREHNRSAEWLSNMAKDRERRTGRKTQNENTDRFTQNNTKKRSNWKAPRHYGIHEFWIKKFTTIHDRIALKINRCLQGAHVLELMTKRKITLIKKKISSNEPPQTTNDTLSVYRFCEKY